MHAPRLISAAQTADRRQKILDALQVKLQADKTISGHVVNDRGAEKGVKLLEDLQNKPFNDLSFIQSCYLHNGSKSLKDCHIYF